MKKLSLILLLSTTLLFPGCWDLKEMEKLAFVSAIGIDSGPEKDESSLTVEIITPQQSGSTTAASGSDVGTNRKSVVYHASGKTYTLAMSRLQQIMENRLFLSQVKVLVIGEEAARNNMSETMRFLERTTELRRSIAVLVTSGRAEDVLSTTGQRSLATAENIRSLLDQTEQTGAAVETSLQNGISFPLAVDGIEPVATRVIATRFSNPSDGKGTGDTSRIQDDQGSQGLVPQKDGIIRVSGMAAFQGDRFVGWLNEKESRGWGWISGRLRHGYTQALSSNTSQEEPDQVTFQRLGGKSSIKSSIENGKVTIYLTVKVQGEVVEWLNNSESIDPATIRKLEADLSDEIKNEIECVLNKAQKELKSDIFGFGFQLSRQHHLEWNQQFNGRWAELFPLIPVEIKVDVTILHTGSISKSLEEDESK